MPARREEPLHVAYEGRTDGITHGSWALVNRRLRPALEARAGLAVHACDPGQEPLCPGPWDVWLSHYYPGLEPGRAFILPPAGARRWVAWVAWEHGPVPMHWEDAWRAGRVAEVWACSEHTRRLLLASTSLDPAKVRVVAYGVDTALFNPEGPTWDLQTEAFRVLYVGGAVPRKGFDLVVEAFDRAFRPEDGARLVLKLQGLRSFYRNEPPAEAPGRPDVQVLGADDYTDEQMAMLYRSVDVVCQPYRAEGFCLPALEAMASGRVVVYPAHGPVPEYAAQDVGAISVPVFGGEPAVDSLARALRWLWRDGETRAHMAKQARNVSLGLDWTHVAEGIEEKLREVVAGSGDAFTPPAPARPAPRP